MPRNSKNPKTSVKVVTTTADATAGSTPIRRRNSGTPAPTHPAMIMLPSMARHPCGLGVDMCENGKWSLSACQCRCYVVLATLKEHMAGGDRDNVDRHWAHILALYWERPGCNGNDREAVDPIGHKRLSWRIAGRTGVAVNTTLVRRHNPY